jgi:predicted Rossmann-fold nucleotide-binding protein
MIMAKILVTGALDQSQKGVQEFVNYLAAEIVEQDHILLNGCRNGFDRLIANATYECLQKKGIDPTQRMMSYVVDDGSAPIHTFGMILRSRLKDWDITFKRLQAPEPIQKADVVIVLGGSEGTMRAANWARIDNKPLLPVTVFGGVAGEIYNEELKDFDRKYAERIDKNDYEMLNQVYTDWNKIAKDVISLAELLISSKDVFVIMSFSRDPKLEDAFSSFTEICEEYGYRCDRIDNTSLIGRIVPEIHARIKKSALVIVDLTEAKPNVYYELGFAQGKNKQVILTAFEGTDLPFDVADIPTIFWNSQQQLKDHLREKVELIALSQGRKLQPRKSRGRK